MSNNQSKDLEENIVDSNKVTKKATKKASRKTTKKTTKSVDEPIKANDVVELKTTSEEIIAKPKTTKKASKKKAPPSKNRASKGENKIEESTHDTTPEGQVKNDSSSTKNHKKNPRFQKHNNRRNNKGGNNNNNSQKKKEKTPVVLVGDPFEVEGILELAPKGFGFLRVPSKDWEQSGSDVFVTPDTIRKYGLRNGAWIKGMGQEGQRGPQIVSVSKVNDLSTEKSMKLPHFEELKAVNPSKRIPFETSPEKFTTRILDIIAPIGRGQRGLIVSPPRSGKTTILVDMAEAILEKHQDNLKLIVLLVDERPEEVTDFKRRLPDVEIFASSNDSGARNHCRIAELCIERAKRLVESGEHVFVMMDSITRLARAYNYSMGHSKTAKGKGFQSGGLVAGAMEMPRKLFAAARNTREAGSLTIIATALVQTNSRADEAIFQEFKGTGNMELVLDRRLAELYLFPAVDIFKSGTRREELLLPEISLRKIHLIRRGLAGQRPEDAIERLIFFLKKFNSNAQMLIEIKG